MRAASGWEANITPRKPWLGRRTAGSFRIATLTTPIDTGTSARPGVTIQLPTGGLSSAAHWMGVSPLAEAFSSATSLRSSLPTTAAGTFRPSRNRHSGAEVSSLAFVRMYPAASTTAPRATCLALQ